MQNAFAIDFEAYLWLISSNFNKLALEVVTPHSYHKLIFILIVKKAKTTRYIESEYDVAPTDIWNLNTMFWSF